MEFQRALRHACVDQVIFNEKPPQSRIFAEAYTGNRNAMNSLRAHGGMGNLAPRRSTAACGSARMTSTPPDFLLWKRCREDSDRPLRNRCRRQAPSAQDVASRFDAQRDAGGADLCVRISRVLGQRSPQIPDTGIEWVSRRCVDEVTALNRDRASRQIAHAITQSIDEYAERLELVTLRGTGGQLIELIFDHQGHRPESHVSSCATPAA